MLSSYIVASKWKYELSHLQEKRNLTTDQPTKPIKKSTNWNFIYDGKDLDADHIGSLSLCHYLGKSSAKQSSQGQFFNNEYDLDLAWFRWKRGNQKDVSSSRPWILRQKTVEGWLKDQVWFYKKRMATGSAASHRALQRWGEKGVQLQLLLNCVNEHVLRMAKSNFYVSNQFLAIKLLDILPFLPYLYRHLKYAVELNENLYDLIIQIVVGWWNNCARDDMILWEARPIGLFQHGHKQSIAALWRV